MKLYRSASLIVCVLFYSAVAAQNVSINVLTRNSGIVQKGETVFFEVTINNTDPSQFVGVYKLKAQINIPDSFLIIQTLGHQLPTGWEIISNSGNTITVSNAKDIIANSDSRTLLIAIKGVNICSSKILSGQLSFSNGIAPGADPGYLKDDNPADNYSTSSCQVIK